MPPTKRISAVVTIQLEAGAASMGKAGQALGPHGVNIVEVVRAYNAATKSERPRRGPRDRPSQAPGPEHRQPRRGREDSDRDCALHGHRDHRLTGLSISRSFRLSGAGSGGWMISMPAPSTRPLRVLTWHIHGSYLWYLSHVPVTWLLPVTPERTDGYGGRGETFDWPDNVVEVPRDQVRDLDVDVVLTQHRRNWEHDRHALLGDRVHTLPRVHIEHDPPPSWPNDALHPVQDEDATLVHVTPYNALMWDSGITPSRVVDHGVVVPDLPWTGERAAAVTVVNNLYRRGRRLGPDVFDRVAAQVPVDLAGMNGEPHTRWLGDVRLRELHARLPSYRAFFNPIRYTSLGLAVCEAMALGLPVVGLATTEMASAVRNGVNGYVETDASLLPAHLHRLLADRDEAAALSAGARKVARERFGIEGFVRNWSAVLHAAASTVVGDDQPRQQRPGA